MSEYKLVPVELLSELAESLASELDARYPDSIRSYESQERKYQAEMESVLTARQIIAAAPAVQEEPVAWIRKWSLDGEKPSKERNKNGRMALPMKFKLHEVTRNRCLSDDVALYTAPQPAADVKALVEALEGIMRVEARDRIMPVGAEWDAARAALAAWGDNDGEK